MMTRNDAANWLLNHDNFCILTHVRPDGDTLGSASALCVGLRQLGKNAYLLHNDGASPFLDRCQLGLTKQWPADHDTLITVDVAAPRMLPEEWLCLQERMQLRIDHHASATSFTEEELVDASSAACGEIVYDLLMAMGCEMTKEIAWRLYIAISTDTGCFRYSNTSAHTYQVAAACAATMELFDTTSISELKLQNWMVDHATFLCNGMAAVCAIPKELEESVSAEDLEGVSGFLRSLEGVKISATIRQTETGSKMSVRAVPGFDAAEVCKKFGGGGHKGAAGAGLNVPLEEAAKLACEALTEVVMGK